jgi:hypothetical protein
MAGYRLVFKGLKAFNKALDNFGERTIPAAHLALQKKIAIDLFSKIVKKTPVGNPDLWKESSLPPPPGYVGGRARANWQISITTPPSSGNDGAEPETGVQTDFPITGLQQARGFSQMAQAKYGQTIWIYNNVRYIKRLEDGWSYRQAPAGMVAISIAEFQAGLTN